MTGANATNWTSMGATNHRYSSFDNNLGPQFFICGRCGAAVIDGLTMNQHGSTHLGIAIHDEWHAKIENPAQEDPWSLAMRLQSYLEPGMRIVAEKAVADRTSDILEMTRAIKDFVDDAKAELQAMLSEPIEHEPSTTIPGVRRAQPDFTVPKES